MGISNIVFLAVFLICILFFIRNLRRIISNIRLGTDIDRSDRKLDRWKNMIRVALGQSKMVSRPVSGILHILVYLGFILINIELLTCIDFDFDGLALLIKVFIEFQVENAVGSGGV